MASGVGGYVLAGGKSSRMGRDKALLELGGRPLVAHAIEKLRRICKEVHILGARPELEAYGPLVRDVHEGCGPLGGIEAALAHSAHKWNLFVPVDMPFLPGIFLKSWIGSLVAAKEGVVRIAMFTVGGRPQPTLCLLHRQVRRYIELAVARGEFKVYPVLESAGRDMADREGIAFGRVFSNRSWNDDEAFAENRDMPTGLTTAQEAAKPLWFANLNTPAEFAEAEKHLDALIY